jgi:hypothetical protein
MGVKTSSSTRIIHRSSLVSYTSTANLFSKGDRFAPLPSSLASSDPQRLTCSCILLCMICLSRQVDIKTFSRPDIVSHVLMLLAA